MSRASSGSPNQNTSPEKRPVSVMVRPRMNLGILLIVVLMVCYGLLILFSASMTEGYASEGDPTYYVAKQAWITMGGVLLMVFLAAVKARIFNRPFLVLIVYGFITGLLVLMHVAGPSMAITINGATRWLDLPGLPRFQPSELAKVGMVFCFAGYTSWIRKRRETQEKKDKRGRAGFIADGFWQFVVPVLALSIWIVLVLAQPHLSGAVILTLLAACCFFAAGFSFRVWAAGLLILLVLVVLIMIAAVNFLLPALPDDSMDQYQYWTRRVNVFTDSDTASEADRYQSEQSMIAIGSGGLTGVGLGQGRQKFNYLPEEFNDYVFSILSEELGLIGSVSVILLFTVFLFMGTSAAARAMNPYAKILIFGYTSLIVLQAFLNIGVAVGVLPPTGISLPMFSYGGTSNLFFLAGIGLMLGASRISRVSAAQTGVRRESHA